MTEPLLDQKNYRMRLYPIQYEDIWDLYRKSVAAFWVPDEIRIHEDLTDWVKLDADEKRYLLTVLAFFASSDFIVNENLDNDFSEQVAFPELKMLYHIQEAMEDIHTQTYQILLNTFSPDDASHFDAVRSSPSIRAKAEWAREWIAKGSWVERLLVFACVEGIFFSSSFCSIFWCKKRGILPGLCQSNELISRDEGMHMQTSCLLYREYVQKKMPKEFVKDLIRTAVGLESDFVAECLPYRLAGMNASLMSQYVRYVADFVCNLLIGEKIFGEENPFTWMSLISMENKTNFFEKTVTEYKRIADTASKTETSVSFTDDF